MLLLRLQGHSADNRYGAAAAAALRACSGWMRQVPTGTFQLLLAREA
jgi:hypothetical protein